MTAGCVYQTSTISYQFVPSLPAWIQQTSVDTYQFEFLIDPSLISSDVFYEEYVGQLQTLFNSSVTFDTLNISFY